MGRAKESEQFATPGDLNRRCTSRNHEKYLEKVDVNPFVSFKMVVRIRAVANYLTHPPMDISSMR